MGGNINFVFLSIDPNVAVQQPADWDRFLGHDKRWKEGGPETMVTPKPETFMTFF